MLYNRAMLMCYAPNLEPFGLVPIEAMACGTPVVGIREGGVRETVRDGSGGISLERDLDEFAKAVSRIIEDDAYRERLSKEALEYIHGFWTWDLAVERLLTHIRTCISNAGGYAEGAEGKDKEMERGEAI